MDSGKRSVLRDLSGRAAQVSSGRTPRKQRKRRNVLLTAQDMEKLGVVERVIPEEKDFGLIYDRIKTALLETSPSTCRRCRQMNCCRDGTSGSGNF